MSGWGDYAFAALLLITLPLWDRSSSHSMMTCRDWRPIPPGVSPCATEDQLHKARLERFHRAHGEAA